MNPFWIFRILVLCEPRRTKESLVLQLYRQRVGLSESSMRSAPTLMCFLPCEKQTFLKSPASSESASLSTLQYYFVIFFLHWLFLNNRRLSEEHATTYQDLELWNFDITKIMGNTARSKLIITLLELIFQLKNSLGTKAYYSTCCFWDHPLMIATYLFGFCIYHK